MFVNKIDTGNSQVVHIGPLFGRFRSALTLNYIFSWNLVGQLPSTFQNALCEYEGLFQIGIKTKWRKSISAGFKEEFIKCRILDKVKGLCCISMFWKYCVEIC